MTGPNVQSNSRRVPVFSVDSVTALLKRRRSINEHSLFRHQSTIQPPFNFATLIKSKTVKKKKKKKLNPMKEVPPLLLFVPFPSLIPDSCFKLNESFESSLNSCNLQSLIRDPQRFLPVLFLFSQLTVWSVNQQKRSLPQVAVAA